MSAKNRRKSRGVVVGKKSGVIVGVRKLTRFGNNIYIALPREWLEKHELEAGDEVPFVANAIFEIVPIKEVD